MNTPTPLGKQTFAEYEKEVKDFKAFNLKAEKVELGLAQDLDKSVSKSEGFVKKSKKVRRTHNKSRYASHGL